MLFSISTSTTYNIQQTINIQCNIYQTLNNSKQISLAATVVFNELSQNKFMQMPREDNCQSTECTNKKTIPW